MPLWRNTTLQKKFWSELGEWLEDVDMARIQDMAAIQQDDDDGMMVVKSSGQWNGKGKGKEKRGRE